MSDPVRHDDTYMTTPWVELRSGGTSELARYDIRAEDPHTIIDAEDFGDVAEWLDAHHLEYAGPLPFAGGLIGMLEYGWPQPKVWLMAPQKITIWDRVESCAWHIRTCYGATCRVEIEAIQYGPHPRPGLKLAGAGSSGNPESTGCRIEPGMTNSLSWTPALSKQDYVTQVARILHYIREGDIYQANFAQTFTTPFNGDVYAFWQQLLRQNPAAFFAYINRPDQEILCTSPELLLRQRGNYVESRPIKGTRPRGRTAEEDAAQCAELLASEKEGAELNMIVDLVRNDLHHSCVTGSVTVRQHRVIEAYQNVFHQISVVSGELPSEKTNIAALAALFPGGSITGCPKVRAMEIIADTERRPRGIYTGSIGYASLHGTQDWNIAIRTATVQDGTMSLSVGGGIVADSIPEEEYAEILHKAATFFSKKKGGTV